MKLVILLAVVGLCASDKLDKTYLPPPNAKTAGGESASLQTPVQSFEPNHNAPQFIHSIGPKFSGAQFNQPGLGQPRPFPSNNQGPSSPFNGPSSQHKFGHFATSGSGFQPSGPSNYQPSGPSNYQPSGPSNYQPSGPSHQGPERAQAQFERTAQTIHEESDVRPDGYEYSFETQNGIKAQQVGKEQGGIHATGDFAYTGDDGVAVMLTYEADENGYRPKGDHLPTPPPIPEAILRSIQQNAEDEANGVSDDGSYDSGKYQEPSQQQNYGGNGQYGNVQKGYQYQQKHQPTFGKQTAGPTPFDAEPINIQSSFPTKQYIPTPQKYQSQGPLAGQYNLQKTYSGAQQESGPQNNGPTQNSQQYNAQGLSATSSQRFNKPAPNYNVPDQGQSPQHPQTQSTSQDQQFPQDLGVFPRPTPPVPNFEAAVSSASSSGYPSSSISASYSQRASNQQHNAPQKQFGAKPQVYLSQATQKDASNGPSSHPSSSFPTNYNTQGPSSQQYNLPAKQFGAQLQKSPQQDFSGQSFYSQNIPQNGNGANQQKQSYGSSSQPSSSLHVGQGEQFGGPRQPPSFSPEKGYQY